MDATNSLKSAATIGSGAGVPSMPSSGGKKPDDKPKKKLTVTSIILIFVAIIALLISLAFVAMGGFLFAKSIAEPPPSPDGSYGGGGEGGGGNVNCTSWAKAPDHLQAKITAAANKAGIQPALLGAIYLTEHGNSWYYPKNGDWNNAKGIERRDGPFQIIPSVWPEQWAAVRKLGLDSRSISQVSRRDFDVAALTAAVDLAGALRRVGRPSNGSDQQSIMFAALWYNRGPKAALAWAKGGFNLGSPPPNPSHPSWAWGANDYAHRAWKNFRNLNNGCTSTTTTIAGGKYSGGKTAYPMNPGSIRRFNNSAHDCSISKPSGCGQRGHRPFLTLAFPTMRSLGLNSQLGEAVDLMAPTGTPVYAPFDGTVARVTGDGWGHHVAYIRASSNSQTIATMAHIDNVLGSGNKVSAGQRVGTVAPLKSPHLHFELFVRGVPINAGQRFNPGKIWANMKNALGLK